MRGTTADHRRFYNADDARRWGREFVPHWVPPDIAHDSGVVIEVGCGNGPVRFSGRPSIVCDISFGALTRLEHQSIIVCCDAQHLPFRDGSATTYVTVATWEHLPDPAQALSEMDRVLTPGGATYLAPAWNCRSWTHTGVTIQRYRDLPWRLKLTKASLVVRERLIWRAVLSFPRRLRREMSAPFGAPAPLEFRSLTPNLDDYLVSDSDACASIDPHAAVIALLGLGYQVSNNRSIWRRMLLRHDPVIGRKAQDACSTGPLTRRERTSRTGKSSVFKLSQRLG